MNLHLLLPPLLINIIAIPGLFANAAVVYVSVKHRRRLNGTSNYLIALNSAVEFLHQTAHPIWLAIAATGTNFVCYDWAMLVEGPAALGWDTSVTVMVATSVDRLVAVMAPGRHRVVSGRWKREYLGAVTFLCFGYNVFYNTATTVLNALEYPDL